MSGDSTLATEGLADDLSVAAREAAISVAGANAQLLTDNVLALVSGGTVYRPEEVITSAMLLAGPVRRIYQNEVWQALVPNTGFLPPMGIGDGSEDDHTNLVQRVMGEASVYGCTGGSGGVVRIVTTLADNATSPAAGSLRKALNDHATASAADRTTASIIVFDPSLQVGTTRAKINLAGDLVFLGRNLTVDAAALPLGLEFNPGGRPGPIPYGVTSASIAAVTSAANITVPLTTGSFNTNGARIEVGEPVDLHTEDGSGNITATHGTNLTVVSWDSTLHTVTVNGTLPTGAPSGATLIMAGKASGKIGYSGYIGGKAYQNAFPIGGDGAIHRNMIFRNLLWNANWGGDVVDTGNAQDFGIYWWSEAIFFDHCSFTNPDPFHDIMFNVGYGSRGITVRECHMFKHYKAINHFHGIDGSGGTDPLTGITSSKHPYPPATTLNPAPTDYDVITSPGPAHGNSTGAPVTVETGSWLWCWFDTIGDRGPKATLYAQVHMLGCLAENFGETSDPAKQVPTVFPLPPGVFATGGPACQVVEGASMQAEGCSFIPQAGASGGALYAIKNNPAAKSSAGNIRTKFNYYAPGTTVLADSANGDSSLVYDFASRYPYPIPTRLPNATDRALVRANAGAGTTSSMWQLYGSPTPVAAVIATDHGAALGPGGTAASAFAVDIEGGQAQASFAAGVLTLLVEALTPHTTITGNGTATAAAGDFIPWDTSTAVTTTFGTLTLPSNPRNAVLIAAKLLNTATVTGTVVGLNVNTGSGDTFSTGTTTQKQLTFAGHGMIFLFRKSDRTWHVIADDVSLGQITSMIAAAVGATAASLLIAGTAAARVASTIATISTGVYWWETDTGNQYRASVSGSTITWTMVGSLNGAELCTPVTYHPSSAQTDATTTSLVDIAASAVTAAWASPTITGTSFDQAFVFPPSGRVTVEVSGFAKGSGSATVVRISLYDVLGSAAITNTTAPAITGTTQQPFIWKKTITGTPGAAGSVRPQWTISSGTATLSVGGNNGPFRVRVTAAA